MEKVCLANYGGVIQGLLSEILLKRAKGGLLGEYDSIPPRDFFAQLAEKPLPEVVEGKDSSKANEIIRFINGTDDIVNLKRGLNLLLELGRHSGHYPFSREQYNPSLFEMDGED